jgi:hypothetical protein
MITCIPSGKQTLKEYRTLKSFLCMMNLEKVCSIVYHLLSLQGENSDIYPIFFWWISNTVTFQKQNLSVNVFLFNIRFVEDSKILFKRNWPQLILYYTLPHNILIQSLHWTHTTTTKLLESTSASIIRIFCLYHTLNNQNLRWYSLAMQIS